MCSWPSATPIKSLVSAKSTEWIITNKNNLCSGITEGFSSQLWQDSETLFEQQ